MAETPRPPVAIRIVRPYETEEAFLENELETVGKTSIILIGAHSRPAGVILRFEVTLSNGATVLRGEGRVLAFKESAFRGQPGLALRFTRLDPKSKALVDRAAALRDARLAAGTSAPPPSLAMPAVSMPTASMPAASMSESLSAPPQSDPGDPMIAQILASPTPPAPSVAPLSEASESAPPPPAASAPPPPVAPDGNALRQAMAAVFDDAPPVPVEPFVPLASLAPSAPDAIANEPVAAPESPSAVAAPDNRESILSRLRSRAASLTADERDALTRPPR